MTTSITRKPISNDTAERIGGAMECLAALAKLEQDNQSDMNEDHGAYQKRSASAAADLVAQFGPLTPRQEGAFRALVEYISFTMTTGEPNLGQWKPVVAMTAEDLEADIEEARQVAMYGPGGSVAANVPSPGQSPEEPSTPDHEAPLKAAKGLILECAISANAISVLADHLYDECLATDNDDAVMAVIIKDSARQIENRLERAFEQMEGRA